MLDKESWQSPDYVYILTHKCVRVNAFNTLLCVLPILHHCEGFILVNLDKIKNLSAIKGIKQSFLCELCGKNRGWLKDVSYHQRDIPDDCLEIIANALDTTVDYLRDNTDKIEKPRTKDELRPDLIQLINGYESLSDNQKEAISQLIDSMLETHNDK